MKKGWQTQTIGDVCDLATGGTPSRAKPEYFGGHIKWLVSGDINQVEIFDCEGRITEAGKKNSNAKLLPVNSVMIALNGQGKTRGTVALLRTQATCNQSMVSISPKPSSGLLPEFLYANLHGRYEEIRRMTSDDDKDRRGLNMGLVRSIKIPIAPLAEQQRIVGLLDEAFEGLATAKANAEKNLQNARAFFESHLQSVFTQRGPGWVEKKVSEIAKHSLGKMLDKSKNKGEPQPYLRNINVRWFTFDLSDLLQMPFLPTEAEKYTAIKGDVLICEGGYPGRAAIWDEDYPIYFQKALHRVRFHEPELNKWFVYCLSVQDSSGQLKQHFSGTGIQHFTGEVLARFLIPVPPLPELRRAVAKFDALSEETQRLARLYERKQTALDSLKKSLLHQAFTGAL